VPIAELNGLEIAYEVTGVGQPWIITPGGRFHKEFGGIPEMARGLADRGKQVITWDRPNCGASSVVFGGRSESEVQAEALGDLLRSLDVGPTVIIGGSGGARVSLLAAARNPDVAAGLAIWWISGGVPGLLSLANYYCMPSAGAAWRGGMEAVVELPQWQEVLEKNPRNRERFLSMDRDEFLQVMDRWMMAYCACDEGLVPGLTDADVQQMRIPVLVFRSGESDLSHTRATSERVAGGLENARLVEPPWGDTEWNERSADYAASGNTTGLFVRWPLLIPQLVDWADEVLGAPAS
jgi:pimeloyl-ACP methyl ester carboxylesterase